MLAFVGHEVFPGNAGWFRFRSVTWARALWGGLHFVGFNIQISFVNPECYIDTASNHHSVRKDCCPRVPAPEFLERLLESLPSPDITLPLKSTCPSPWVTLCLDFSLIQLPCLLWGPPPGHCLICCSLLIGWLSTLWLQKGNPPSLVSSWTWTQNCEVVSLVVKYFIAGANDGYSLNSRPVRACRPYQCLLREFLNVGKFHQMIPFWHYEINPWGR